MGSLKLHFFSFLCFLVGLGAFVIAFASPRWYWLDQVTQINLTDNNSGNVTFTYSYGLFTRCFYPIKCVKIGWDFSSDINKPILATRIFMIIAGGVLILCTISKFFILFGKRSYNKNLLTTTGVLEIVSGVTVLIAVLAFLLLFSTLRFTRTKHYYDYCFLLAFGASAAFVSSGLLTVYQANVLATTDRKQEYLINGLESSISVSTA